MNRLCSISRRYGKIMTGYILFSIAVWVFGMIILPQIMMVDYSLWSIDEVKQGNAMSQVQLLEAELDDMDETLHQKNIEFEKVSSEAEKRQIESAIVQLEKQVTELEKKLIPLDKAISDPPRAYGLKNYKYLANNVLHRTIFIKTMVVSLIVTLVAFLLCYPIAYYLAQVASNQRAAILLIGLITPYWVNEILRTFAWLMLLSQNGLVNLSIQWLGITSEPIDFLNNNSGVIIGMVYCYVLFMVFPIYNTLDTLDRNQVEAARDLGAGWLRIHRKIAIPHAKPGIAVGCIMTFMVAVGTYAVPSILGGTSSLWFTQIIYSWFFDGGNWNQGSAYAFVLLVLCILFIMSMIRFFKVSLEDIAK